MTDPHHGGTPADRHEKAAPHEPQRGRTPSADSHRESAVSGEGVRPAVVLDCLGQKCPLPVIALARHVRNIGIGEVLRVLADDPAAANDIPAWCRMKQVEFLGSPEPHAFEVRRAT